MVCTSISVTVAVDAAPLNQCYPFLIGTFRISLYHLHLTLQVFRVNDYRDTGRFVANASDQHSRDLIDFLIHQERGRGGGVTLESEKSGKYLPVPW